MIVSARGRVDGPRQQRIDMLGASLGQTESCCNRRATSLLVGTNLPAFHSRLPQIYPMMSFIWNLAEELSRWLVSPVAPFCASPSDCQYRATFGLSSAITPPGKDMTGHIDNSGRGGCRDVLDERPYTTQHRGDRPSASISVCSSDLRFRQR